MSTAIEQLTLEEAARAIARGDVSSEQVTALSLERLRRLGPLLNCVANVADDSVLDVARTLDRERARGKLRGRLHGVPLAHKDLFYRKGRRVACGSKIRRDFVANTTATVLERLDAAGALDLGTLHMSEFAFSPTGYNHHYGHGLNPWDLTRVPGGSSSGSAAAVAARLVYGSLGTDSGGSLRHPAAMCGLTGLKPTQTRVSRAGVMPLSHSLDCVGPLARTARDCAWLLQAIAGPDHADPTAAGFSVPDFDAGLTGDVTGLRIAVPTNYYYDHATEDVRRLLDATLDVYRQLGAKVSPVRVPDVNLFNTLAQVIMGVEAATIHQRWLATRRNEYSDIVRARIEVGLMYPATRYCEALALRGKLTEAFISATLGECDVLHLPAVSIPVPTIEETTNGDPAHIARTLGALTHCTRGINYLGLPAVTLPCGFTANRMPCGFQLVGRPFAEGLLLRVADAYQRAIDWHRRAPALQE
ncbi:MAG: amidase [Betaproteobacteria bacterium]|nr:amidase [Betaproteobacteria bacterium]